MCGIAGIAYFNKNLQVHPRDITRMTDEIIHRGPDDSGYFISQSKQVGLGNRRLAILDLSVNGHQPMTYLDRYTIVSNNEVYNYQSEREKLIKKGYRFKSNCDTEVILALYAEYGTKCVEHMRGMFAIAIYDSKENTLFIARDRIGKKPLKYWLDESKLIFASELKAILRVKGVKKIPDYKALHEYLIYGYCPAPLTGFEGIKKLEPGSFMLVNLNRRSFTIEKYWQPRFDKKLVLSESEWCKSILDILEESTKLRMISDVPIGAFLSGGVDSSGVVATMAQLSTKPIKTFTVAFKDKDLNEAPHAARIAKMYKTDHHVLTAKPQSTEILPFLAKQYEEPFADASSIVTYMVSKMTREHVTVALNGDGGDENFAGYPNRYLRLMRDVDNQKLIRALGPIATETLSVLTKMTSNKKVLRFQKFFENSGLPIYRRFASYNTLFKQSELEKYSLGKLLENVLYHDPFGIVQKFFSEFSGRDLKDAGLKFDLQYFLPDQLLAKSDIASMAASLEARSPLLDQEMIELACKIPFDLKIKHGETKYILKKAFEKIVPKQNLYRPKVGFTIPLERWFKGSLNGYAEHILLNKNSAVSKIYDKERIREMIMQNNSNEDFGPRLWALMSLELWFSAYFP